MEIGNFEIQIEFPTTNYFVYGKREYPFNLNLFNFFSEYFKLKNSLKQNEKINIIEEIGENCLLTDESISDFVNFVQNKKIKINDQNVASLYKLSKHFMVNKLAGFIEEYILSNPNDFIAQFLSLIQDQKEVDTEHYEDIISMQLPDHIKDDLLLSLPFPIIHRVVTKYQLKKDQNKIIGFLFKCLDKYGRRASVLFEKVDFMQEESIYLRKLVNEYSEIFDFHFISKAYHKSLYDIQNEMIQKEESITRQKDEILLLIQNENIQMRNEIKEMKEKQEEMIVNHTKMEQSFIEQLDSLKKQISQMANIITQQNQIILQLKPPQEDLRRPQNSCMFRSESNPKGIVDSLRQSVILSAGGSHHMDSQIENIMNNDDSVFFNFANHGKDGFWSNKLSDSWIEFDFGSEKKVDLHSYFIRSNQYYDSHVYCYHPKSWRIEGSNDRNVWTLLDRRTNDSYLHGSSKQHKFECNGKKHGKKDCRFRYIRYIQDDSWCEKSVHYKNRYNICIQYFELYGDVYQYE